VFTTGAGSGASAETAAGSGVAPAVSGALAVAGESTLASSERAGVAVPFGRLARRGATRCGATWRAAGIAVVTLALGVAAASSVGVGRGTGLGGAIGLAWAVRVGGVAAWRIGERITNSVKMAATAAEPSEAPSTTRRERL